MNSKEMILKESSCNISQWIFWEQILLKYSIHIHHQISYVWIASKIKKKRQEWKLIDMKNDFTPWKISNYSYVLVEYIALCVLWEIPYNVFILRILKELYCYLKQAVFTEYLCCMPNTGLMIQEWVHLEKGLALAKHMFSLTK